MALFRCSSGSSGGSTVEIDFSEPDVMGYASVEANSGEDVLLSQLPKAVVLLEVAYISGSAGYGGVYCYDVTSDTNYTATRKSSGNNQFKSASGYPERISQVTSSRLLITNNSSSERYYFWAIYY